VSPRELAEIEGKPIALSWIDAALVALREYLEWLAGGDEPNARVLVESALATNFSLREPPAIAGSLAKVKRVAFVWIILGTFARAREVIAASARFFAGVSEEEARGFFPRPAGLPPAYAIYGVGVFFTPAFASYDATNGMGFGPLCRAAMLVHESIHVIDRMSGLPEIHISEWQEPAFSEQTARESLHNPSAYASFAAQVHDRALEWPVAVRYGAGRAAD
jgi:hypothetical protein